MRLLLDEMWTPTIALEMRKRGFDVIAASELSHAGRYAGISDDDVFARAQQDSRAVVTDNIADYERSAADRCLPCLSDPVRPGRARAAGSLNLRASVLFIVIPMAWLAFALLGLAMCRLGALSDRSHMAALAKWVADCRIAEREIAPPSSVEQFPFGTNRATG